MQKIIVKNFGPIQEAEIELKDLVILIGEQASGKSTISKLIYFFKTIKNDLYYLARLESISLEDPTNATNLINKVIEGVKIKFRKYFGNPKRLDNNFSAEFYFSDISKIKIYDHSLQISYTPQSFFTEIIKSLRLSAPVISRVIQNNDFDGLKYYESKLIEQLNALFSDKYEPLFIPAGRNITVSYPQEFKDYFLSGKSLSESLSQKSSEIDRELMQRFIGRVGKIQDEFKNRNFQQVLDHQMIFDGETERRTKEAIKIIKLILKGDYSNYGGQSEGIKPIGGRRVIPIQESSSGQQEVIRILQDLFLCLIDEKPVFRVIEEPEAHLFPKAQSQLMQLITLLVNSEKHQILLTTHSPYILSILNNLLFAWNVGEQQPSAKLPIPVDFRLNPKNFEAYVLRDGKSQSIFDKESALIDRNYLDEIFEDIGSEYNTMYDLYADYVTSNDNK